MYITSQNNLIAPLKFQSKTMEPTPTPTDAKVNYTLIGIGIFLLLVGATLFTIYHSLFSDESGFWMIKIFLGLGSALIASQIPGVLGMEVGSTIKAGGAITAFVLVLVFGPTPPSITSSSDQLPPDLSGKWKRDTDVPGKTEVYTFTPKVGKPGQYDFTIDFEGTNLPNPPVHHTGSGGFLPDSLSYAEFDLNRVDPIKNCTVRMKSIWKLVDDDHALEGSRPISNQPYQCGLSLADLTNPPTRAIKREN